MTRKLAALCVAGMLVAAIGCSKTETATTTTTTAKPAASNTGSKPAGAKALPKATNLPKVTKPAPGATVDKSKVPAGSTGSGFGLTSDEEDCVGIILVGVTVDDPTMATDTNKLAGAIGASMVACVPQEKIASSLVTAMSQGGKLDETQKACLTTEFTTASSDDMALFLGIIIAASQASKAVGDELIKPYAESLSASCNIPMSS